MNEKVLKLALESSFLWIDYFFFAFSLIIFSLVGVWIGWKDRHKTISAKDFLTVTGQIHWVPISFAFQASFFSAIFLLSNPGEIYAFGISYIYLGISYICGMLIAGFYFLPVYNELNIINVYEYLELRFNKTIRQAGSFIYIFQTLLYLPLVLYVPSLALAKATGFEITYSIVFCGIICTLYTSVGGMKATVWNDSIQMIVIYLGMSSIAILGVWKVGGVTSLYTKSVQGKRLSWSEPFEFDFTKRVSFYTQTIGGISWVLMFFASNQTLIQKSFSSTSFKNNIKSLIMCIFCCLYLLFLVCVIGLVSYIYFIDCDPISTGHLRKLDEVIPIVIMQVLKGLYGLPGLFIATIFSAALSSMAGCLNGMAAVWLTDIIEPLIKKKKGGNFHLLEKPRVIITRCIVIFFGAYTTVSSFQAHAMGESVIHLVSIVLGLSGGPLIGIIFLGFSCRFANSLGCLVGFLVSIGLLTWISLGSLISKLIYKTLPFSVEGCSNHTLFSLTSSNTTYQIHPVNNDHIFWLYQLSFNFYISLGLITTVLVGMVVSLATGGCKQVDDKLLFSFMRRRSGKKIDSELILKDLISSTEKPIYVSVESREEDKKVNNKNETNDFILETILKNEK